MTLHTVTSSAYWRVEVLWCNGIGVLKEVTYSIVWGHEFDVTFHDEKQDLILQIQMETAEICIVGTMSRFPLLCLYGELS